MFPVEDRRNPPKAFICDFKSLQELKTIFSPFLVFAFGRLLKILTYPIFLQRLPLSHSQVLNAETKAPDTIQISYWEKLHRVSEGYPQFSIVSHTHTHLSLECPLQLMAGHSL